MACLHLRCSSLLVSVERSSRLRSPGAPHLLRRRTYARTPPHPHELAALRND